MPRRAKKSETAGDRGRTGNNQLGRLAGANGTLCYERNCAKSAAAPAYSPDSLSDRVLHDVDLARVIATWATLPEPIRLAIVTLVRSVERNTDTETS